MPRRKTVLVSSRLCPRFMVVPFAVAPLFVGGPAGRADGVDLASGLVAVASGVAGGVPPRSVAAGPLATVPLAPDAPLG